MKKIIVEMENSGSRIDKFLAKEFFSYTRGELIRRIKKGEVRVNGKTIKPSFELKEGDRVETVFADTYEIFAPNHKLEIEIVYQDENILAINKPAGLQVHPSGNEKENTLANWLIAKFPEIAAVHDDSVDAQFRPGIVHRLDKDTSGIMVIALKKRAFNALKKLFKDRKIKKTYLAIVWGIFEQKKGIIDKPLARSLSRQKQTVADQRTKTVVRDAVTEYAVKQEIGEYSLVEVSPKTGRMHQIRIHLSVLGHPVVGDVVYINKNLKTKNRALASRQLLHAKQIKFVLFKKEYCFNTAMPADFDQFLGSIDEKRDV